MAGDHLVRHVVTFGRVLREVGLEVGPGRVADALRALAAVDLTRQEDVFFSLRQTLVSRHDELDLFDRAEAAHRVLDAPWADLDPNLAQHAPERHDVADDCSAWHQTASGSG